jgi:hypothetical protein
MEMILVIAPNGVSQLIKKDCKINNLTSIKKVKFFESGFIVRSKAVLEPKKAERIMKQLDSSNLKKRKTVIMTKICENLFHS